MLLFISEKDIKVKMKTEVKASVFRQLADMTLEELRKKFSEVEAGHMFEADSKRNLLHVAAGRNEQEKLQVMFTAHHFSLIVPKTFNLRNTSSKFL